ncbi:MAG TPA: TolC family protein [Bryobacteraceae bacterium]|nr:TolC family protein [Bryobacteraceae bacterium]
MSRLTLGFVLFGTLQAQTLTLDDLENMALRNNPSLGEASARVRMAAGYFQQAGLYPNPTAGYEGEQIRGGEQRGGEQGFFVTQSIVLGGKLGAAKRVAGWEQAEAETSSAAQRLRVRNNVRVLFYQTLAAQRLVDVRRDLAKLARDAAATSHQLGNIGQADRPDLLQAEVEAEQAELNVATAVQLQQAVWRTLAVTVGHPDLPPARLAGTLENYPDLDLQQSLAAALRDSPVVKLARQDLERTEASVVQARKTPVPDLLIRGGLEQNFEPRGPGQRPIGLQGIAEIGVQLPLFNRNQGNIEAARASVDRAKFELSRTQLELRRQLTMLFRDYAIARATAERYKTEMLPRAQKAYDLYRNNYQAMAAAYPQVLLAQRTLFQLQADYVQALERVWESALSIQGFGLMDGLAEP